MLEFICAIAVLVCIGVGFAVQHYQERNRCDHRFIHAVVSKKAICSTCHADVSGENTVNLILADPIVDFLDWWSSYPASKLKSAAIPDPPVMIQSEMHDLADLYQLEKNHAA